MNSLLKGIIFQILFDFFLFCGVGLAAEPKDAVEKIDSSEESTVERVMVFPEINEGRTEQAFFSEARPEKLCLFHYVAWGFDHVGRYDEWFKNPRFSDPLTDRTLLGKNLQWDSGVGEAVRRQIDTARLYGADGFVVDVVRTDAFCSSMSRFFRAAEGTDFKIVLCVDNYARSTVSELVKSLQEFTRRYRNHPNSWLVDDRLVIFAYNLGVSAEDWGKVQAELNSDPETSVYVLPRLIREGVRREDPAELQNWLSVCDGIYDFGCNGFFLEEMKDRLQAGKEAIFESERKSEKEIIGMGSPEKSGKKMLVAGIAPGYLGFATGFYRPFLNTRSLRDNWAAAMAVGAEHVCVTTWNDYAEHTHFEPSVHNRTALLRLNQEFIRLWRGEPAPKRPPEVLLGWHEEILDGSDWTLEILNFSYSTEKEIFFLRLLDEKGKLLKEFAPIPLPKEKMAVTTLRVPEEMMKAWRLVRIQGAKMTEKEAAEKRNGQEWDSVFRELPPMVRRCGHIETPRTVRTVWSELSCCPAELRLEGEKAVILLKTWTAAGRLELVRNGWPVWEEEISHIKAPVFRREVTLPAERAPWDVYYARFTNVSDGVSWSNPVSRISGPSDEMVKRKILRTGADFDEEWGIWIRAISRMKTPVWEEREIPAWADFRLDFSLKEPQNSEKNIIFSASGWRLPMLISEEKWIWDEESGANVLEFSGKTFGRFQSRTLPVGPFRINLEIMPKKTGREMVLFHDTGGVKIALDGEGLITFSNRKQTLRSQLPVTFGKWILITARYDGQRLVLSVDSRQVAECPASSIRSLINSVPFIGCDSEKQHFFEGKMRRFSIYSE